MKATKAHPGHVFISYVREDERYASLLHRALESAGVSVWRDTANLWPGQDWRAMIRHEITRKALVFLACFSRQSLAREVSYQNEELALAVEQMRLRRPGQLWFIPVRFDDCEIPELDIGGGRTLATIQCADLFGDHAPDGTLRLVTMARAVLSGKVADPDRYVGYGAGELSGGDDPTGGSDSRLPRPMQLPRAIPDLRGRDDEIKSLYHAIADPEPTTTSRVAIITGRGGMGKTALAVSVGALAKAAFPDGILYADLGGTKVPPHDPDISLESFIISLGIPPEVASSASADKIGLYRSVLADRRCLVILDNANSTEQVNRLLPAEPMCAAIVTSRNRLSSLRPDLTVSLGPISDEAAQQVLSFYLGVTAGGHRPEAGQINELAKLCGNWPLVLHLAGGLIARRSAASVRELIIWLSDEKTRLDSLRVDDIELRMVIEDSARRLTADGAALFRRISLIPGSDVPAWLIGTLAEAGAARARSALSELVDANLIDILLDIPDERYSIHELVRDMSREKLYEENPGDVNRARITMFEAYRKRAVLSRMILEPDRPPYGRIDASLTDNESALLDDVGSPERWLQSEKAALMGLVEEAYALGLDDMAVSVANCLPTYFIIRGTWNEWSATYETAIKAAERSGDLVGLGYLLQGLANIQRTKGQGTGAPSLERSLASLTTARDPVGRAYVLNDIGLIRMYEGRWAEADDALSESARGLTENGHPTMALQPRRNRAIALLERGEAERAAGELEQICEEMGRRGDVRWRAHSLADLGKAYRLLGNPDMAAERLTDAIHVMLSIGDNRWAAVTRIRLGDVYRSVARPTEADAEYRQAAEFFDQLADPVWAARAMVSRALVALDQVRLPEANSICLAGRQTFRMLSSKEDECWSLVVQSRIYETMGDYDGAAEALEAARTIARELGRDDDLVDQFLADRGPDVR